MSISLKLSATGSIKKLGYNLIIASFAWKWEVYKFKVSSVNNRRWCNTKRVQKTWEFQKGRLILLFTLQHGFSIRNQEKAQVNSKCSEYYYFIGFKIHIYSIAAWNKAFTNSSNSFLIYQFYTLWDKSDTKYFVACSEVIYFLILWNWLEFFESS